MVVHNMRYRFIFEPIFRNTGWTPRRHEAWAGHCDKTNLLFATLLLGIERLNALGAVGQIHNFVSEETLECWTFKDATDIGDLTINPYLLEDVDFPDDNLCYDDAFF